MFYYLKKKGKLEKYTVEIDHEALKSLRLEIIFRCSEISHIEDTTTATPNYFDYERIQNYTEKKVGRTDGGFYTPSEDIYHVSYDYYNHPYLVSIIDRLLKDDKTAIAEILKPDYSKEAVSFEKRIANLESKINDIPTCNTAAKVAKLKELEELLQKSHLNQKQASVKKYYSKAKKLITFTLVDTMSLKDIQKVGDFIGKNLFYNINN